MDVFWNSFVMSFVMSFIIRVLVKSEIQECAWETNGAATASVTE